LPTQFRAVDRSFPTDARAKPARPEEAPQAVPLAGWYRSSFAWARRPLAEAGLR